MHYFCEHMMCNIHFNTYYNNDFELTYWNTSPCTWKPCHVVRRKIVRVAIAQVIATAAKHDLPTNAWPQLFAFIIENVKNEDPSRREVFNKRAGC